MGVVIKRPDRTKRDRDVLLAQSGLIFEKGVDDYHYGEFSRKKFDGLDLVFVPSDGTLLDILPALVHQLFTEQYNVKEGASEQGEFLQEVTGYYPKDKRLVIDFKAGRIDEPGIREKFSNTFLAETLATGVKLELLLYLLPLLLDRNKGLDEWGAIILIDELGGGLHLERQVQLTTAILDAFQRNHNLANRVKIVATTHSPMVYSSFSARPELVDTVFVVRRTGETSQVLRLGEGGDDYINEMMRQQLWLNMLKLNNAILFVEGKTDKWLFEEVFGFDPFVTVLQTTGAGFSDAFSGFVSELDPAPKGEYWQLVEKGMEGQAAVNVQRLKEAGIKLSLTHHPYQSIEELMCGFEFKGRSTMLWKGLQAFAARIETMSEDLRPALTEKDIERAAMELLPKGKAGFDSFIRKWKRGNRYEDLYRTCGKHQITALLEPDRKVIYSIVRDVSGKPDARQAS